MQQIDRDRLLNILDALPFAAMEFPEFARVNHIIRIIKSQPIIEQELSEWLSMVKPETVVWRECKACGAEVEGPAYPFCPYCGKPMRNGVQKCQG